MSETLTGPDVEWLLHFPIAKAVEDDDGRLWVEGIASDESVDLQNEIVKASGLEGTLNLLEERGVFNWDHGKATIGRPTQCSLMDAEEARKRFPELKEWFDRDFVGDKVFYLKGYVDPPAEGEQPSEDLHNARHALLHGHPIGFSLEGGRLQRGAVKRNGVTYPSTEQAVLTKVAITNCPINKNSVARLAKSLSAAMQDDAEGDGPVVVLAKGLSAGSGTDSSSFTGGRAMTPESLHDTLEDTIWTCRKCATSLRVPAGDDDDDAQPPRCRVCGGETVRRYDFRKSLDPLSRIAFDLDATTEETTMSTRLENARAAVGDALGDFAKSVDPRNVIKGLSILGKGLDLDDEEAEDIDEALEDVGDEMADAMDEEGVPEDMPEDPGDEPALGVEDDEDVPPSEDETDAILAELDEAEDAVPDLDEEDDEYEDEDEEDEPMRKSVEELMQEADPENYAVLDAEGLIDGVIGPFAKSVEGRIDDLEEALADNLTATAGLIELVKPLVGELPDVRKSVEQVEEAEQKRREALGAMPAGSRFAKSAKDSDPDLEPAELQSRIQKCVRSDKLTVRQANVMDRRVRSGDLEGVAEDLTRYED